MDNLEEAQQLAFNQLIARVTVPILASVGTDVIDQIGTATLFSVADRLFLVTARHIFDDFDPADLGAPSNPFKDPTPATFGKMTIFRASEEEVDVAVAELLDEQIKVKLLAGWRVLTFDNISMASDTGSFVLCGYPSARAKRGIGRIGGSLMSAATVRIPIPANAKPPVQPDLDLFFQYDDKAELLNGGTIDTPHLGGTSGASVWEYRPDNGQGLWTAEGAYKIIGVQSAFSRPNKYFRAKSWKYVLKLFADDGGEAGMQAREFLNRTTQK